MIQSSPNRLLAVSTTPQLGSRLTVSSPKIIGENPIFELIRSCRRFSHAEVLGAALALGGAMAGHVFARGGPPSKAMPCQAAGHSSKVCRTALAAARTHVGQVRWHRPCHAACSPTNERPSRHRPIRARLEASAQAGFGIFEMRRMLRPGGEPGGLELASTPRLDAAVRNAGPQAGTRPRRRLSALSDPGAPAPGPAKRARTAAGPRSRARARR